MEEMEAPECHGIICTLCKSMGQATYLKYVETCTKSYMVTTTPPHPNPQGTRKPDEHDSGEGNPGTMLHKHELTVNPLTDVSWKDYTRNVCSTSFHYSVKPIKHANTSLELSVGKG